MRADIAAAAALNISRNKAGELIRAGLVAFDGAVLNKPSQELDLGDKRGANSNLGADFGAASESFCGDFGSRFALLGEFFVSRAALKLKAFLEDCDAEFSGENCANFDGENPAQNGANSNLDGGGKICANFGGSSANSNLEAGDTGGANSNLEAGGAKFAIDARGKIVLDVGASTGGFTQIWLSRGAKSVVALDVGSAQLHAKLRADSRVIVRENCDVRDFYPPFCAADLAGNLTKNSPQNPAQTTQNSAKISPQNPQNSSQNSPQNPPILPTTPPQNPAPTPPLPAAFDIVSADVSFISLALVLPHLARLCAENLVVLFKPQFEVGTQARRGKNGVVRDQRAIAAALAGFEAQARALGLVVRRKNRSEVAGKEGNFEWFFWLQKTQNQGQK